MVVLNCVFLQYGDTIKPPWYSVPPISYGRQVKKDLYISMKNDEFLWLFDLFGLIYFW